MTKEHVPPRAAGNTETVCVHNPYSLSKGWSRGEIFQHGHARRTLCGTCNGETGKHYVPEFARWTLQAYEYQPRVPDDNRLALPFTFSALRVAKQLAVMVLAMSEPAALDLPHYLQMRQLVMSPLRYGRVARLRFFTYFEAGEPSFEGCHAAISISGGPSPTIICKVGLAPLGYIVTGDDALSIAWATRLRLCDISHFFEFPLDVCRAERLAIPRLRGDWPFRPVSRDSP